MSVKSTVDAKAFSEALRKVSKVLKNCGIPCLNEVHVRFTGEKCVLTGTDLETWLTTELPARGDEFAFVLCRTKDVERACRHFDGGLTLELSESGDVRHRQLRLHLYCGSRGGEFDAQPPEDYPEMDQMEVQTELAVNTASLLERVERVRYATLAPGDHVRASSTCVQFSGHRVFALDGCRVACDTDKSVSFPQPFLATGESLSYLKLLDGEQTTIQMGKRHIRFSDGGRSIRVRAVESEIFNLDQAIPKDCREEFYVSPREFLQELAYLKEIAPDTNRPYVRFCGGELSMSVLVHRYHTAVQVEGRSEIVFGFDLRHMKDALRQFRKEDRVKIKVASEFSPLVIEAEGRGDFAMVCPVRLRDELAA